MYTVVARRMRQRMRQMCVCCAAKGAPPSQFVMSVRSTIELNVLTLTLVLFVKYSIPEPGTAWLAPRTFSDIFDRNLYTLPLSIRIMLNCSSHLVTHLRWFLSFRWNHWTGGTSGARPNGQESTDIFHEFLKTCRSLTTMTEMALTIIAKSGAQDSISTMVQQPCGRAFD